MGLMKALAGLPRGRRGRAAAYSKGVGIQAQVTIDAASLAELQRKMAMLPATVVNRVVAAATVEAMQPVLKASKAKAPVRYGYLRDSLETKTKIYRLSGTVVTMVGPADGKGAPGIDPVKYAHLAEAGTAPHGNHPGARAQPFLRPAIDENKERVVSILRSKVLAGIDAAVEGRIAAGIRKQERAAAKAARLERKAARIDRKVERKIAKVEKRIARVYKKTSKAAQKTVKRTVKKLRKRLGGMFG